MKKSDYSVEELIPIVAKLVKKYTSNDSTSISYQVARQLMDCILYHINELLQNRGKEYARNVSSKMSAQEAYELGGILLKKKIISSENLYQVIISDFNAYQNLAYEETIVKGMPCFFARYDAKFNAQDHLLTLDYPLLYPIKELMGIDLIFEYLKRTRMEQLFLEKFPEEKIICFLLSYEKDYKELFINISQLVFRQAIKCMLVGTSMSELKLEKRDLKELKYMIKNKTREEEKQLLVTSLKKLVGSRYDDQEEIYEYLHMDINDFVVELEILKEEMEM